MMTTCTGHISSPEYDEFQQHTDPRLATPAFATLHNADVIPQAAQSPHETAE
jgi:hypothetical protein